MNFRIWIWDFGEILSRVSCLTHQTQSPQFLAVKDVSHTPLTKGGRGDPFRASQQPYFPPLLFTAIDQPIAKTQNR